MLGGAFRKLAGERQTGVGEGMIDQFPLVAAKRANHPHPMAGVMGESVFEQPLAGDRVADQHQLGNWLVLIELTQEGAEN